MLTTLPPDNETLRLGLYQGDIFHLDPTPASLGLVSNALSLLQQALPGSEDVRSAAAALDDDAFFKLVGSVRRTVYETFVQGARTVAAACGFDPQAIAVDRVKLRAVTHLGHQNPRAAPVYYPHRDTWYGHPQSHVTCWLPLFDTPAEETFVFYREMFDRSVANDSETFDYDEWARRPDIRIGWQNRTAGQTFHYPAARPDVQPGPALGFACRRAQPLLFSGAHFHRTLPHASGRTRFSLDFRIVHLADHGRGLGAPNADNRSRGSALQDYVLP